MKTGSGIEVISSNDYGSDSETNDKNNLVSIVNGRLNEHGWLMHHKQKNLLCIILSLRKKYIHICIKANRSR